MMRWLFLGFSMLAFVVGGALNASRDADAGVILGSWHYGSIAPVLQQYNDANPACATSNATPALSAQPFIGDLILVYVLASTTGTLSAPAGFTQEDAQAPGGFKYAEYYKISTGFDGTSWSVASTVGDGFCSIWALDVSGENQSAPFDQHAVNLTTLTSSSGPFSTNSVTPSQANDLPIAMLNTGTPGQTLSTYTATLNLGGTLGSNFSNYMMVDSPNTTTAPFYESMTTVDTNSFAHQIQVLDLINPINGNVGPTPSPAPAPTPTPTPGAGPALVQFCNSSASDACTLGATPTSSDLLVAEAGDYVNALSCNTGWTQILSYTASNVDGIACKKVVSGDTATVTPLGGTATSRDLKVWEVSGSSLAVDTSGGAEGGTGSQTTTISPASSGDIILSSSFQSQAVTGVTIPAGYIADQTCASACASNIAGDGSAYLTNAASGSQGIAWAFPGSSRAISNIAVAVSGVSATTTPSPTPSPTPTPSGTVLWREGDATLGKWELGTSGQCGSPVVSGASMQFNLDSNPGNNTTSTCYRNIVLADTSSSSTLLLTPGTTYTFSWHYIDGTATDAPASGATGGMGYDRDARGLIFQIHQFNGGVCLGLDFDNGGVIGGTQQWHLSDCGGDVWRSTAYTPGEVDDFKLVVKISSTTPCSGATCGTMQFYRNGVLQTLNLGDNGIGPNVLAGSNSWFSMGPYKWRWSDGGSSSLYHVVCTIQNMLVTY